MQPDSFLFISYKKKRCDYHKVPNLNELLVDNQAFFAHAFKSDRNQLKYSKGIKKLDSSDQGQYLDVTWDFLKQSLTVSTDFFSAFPCYYYEDSDFFACADSIPLLTSIRNIELELDQLKLIEYLSGDNIDGVRTLYRKIKKLTPASTLTYTAKGLSVVQAELKLEDKGLVEKNQSNLIESFKDVLYQAVALGINKEEIAVELSGGLDSSAIYSIIKKYYPEICSISIDFNQLPCSELVYREHLLGTQKHNHFELQAGYVTPQELLKISHSEKDFPDFPNSYSARNLYDFVSKNKKKLILTGFGGDQLLSSGRWEKKPSWFFSKLPERVKKTFRKQKYFPWLKNQGIDFIIESYEELNLNLYKLQFNPYQKALLFNVWHPHTQEILALAQRVATKYGLSKVHPLLNQHLFKLIFNNTNVLQDGNFKMILKEAMRDTWPTKIMLRDSKADFTCTYFETLKNPQYKQVYMQGVERFSSLVNPDFYGCFWEQLEEEHPSTPVFLIWNLIGLELFCASQENKYYV